jgi:hypothetical protein
MIWGVEDGGKNIVGSKWTYLKDGEKCLLMVEALRTSETSMSICQTTVCSPAEHPWLECGVEGDVMSCDRYIRASTTFDATTHSEKLTHSVLVRKLCQF